LPHLLLSDIDGTLLADDGSLPPANREALIACHNAQVTVALATGRRWSTTRKLLDRLDLWNWIDYAILNNGMVIQDLRRREIIATHSFQMDIVTDVSNRFEILGIDPIVLTHSNELGHPDVFYRTLSLMNGDFIDKNQEQSQQVSSYGAIGHRTLVELLLVGSYEDLARAQNALTGLPVETALIKNTFYREWMLEITPQGISKYSGAAFLQDRIGAATHQTMAIGDSANDIPLLRAAHHGVAMDHAPENLKLLAKTIALPNQDGGMGMAVLDWLKLSGF
jgi:Cof subfamily protein (haloacid dehalogenase superfamily)